MGSTSRRRSGRRCESENWWRKGYTVAERDVVSSSVVRIGSDISGVGKVAGGYGEGPIL